jgi:hypothetical protein
VFLPGTPPDRIVQFIQASLERDSKTKGAGQ